MDKMDIEQLRQMGLEPKMSELKNRQYDESNNDNAADYGLIARNDEDVTLHFKHGGAITFEGNRDKIVSLSNVGDAQINRDAVHAFEAEMKKNVPTAEEISILARMKVTHHWSYGIYGRELFLPKGVMIAGEIHKYPNMNVIVSGDISIYIEGQIQRVQAPFIFVAPAGSKRIAHAHEDTVWFMPHRTDEVDLYKIENFFVAHTEEEYVKFIIEQQKLPLIDQYPLFKELEKTGV